MFYLAGSRLNLETYSSGGHQQGGHPQGGQDGKAVGDLPPERPDVGVPDLQQFESIDLQLLRPSAMSPPSQVDVSNFKDELVIFCGVLQEQWWISLAQMKQLGIARFDE